MHSVPMIAVKDVRASAEWYGRLLGCRFDLVAEDFARLRDDDRILVVLHARHADEHRAWSAGASRAPGDGFLLWIVADDFDAVCRRASELHAKIVVEPHRNDAGDARELVLRDPDGYAIAITEPPND
jgi:catechol 2,3-dioxygenase-like lactoylglutathione lyase family enzyme